MIIEAHDALRVWLARELAPVCDAEPVALAKYVQALLRKDKPENELMEFCIEQLDVFLQTQARPFVTKLFEVIRERSYIPQQVAAARATSSNEAPSDSPRRSAPPAMVPEKKKEPEERKEVREKEDERKKIVPEKEREQRKVREDKEPEKKPLQDAPTASTTQPQKAVRKRISPPPASRDDARRDGINRFERRRSRSPRERRPDRGDKIIDRRNQMPPNLRGPHRPNDRYKNERNERVERKRSRSPYERMRRDKSAEGERKKKRCRDYDEKGYCMKGDQCMYDHGPDPVVVDDIALEKMVNSGAKPNAVVPQIAPNFSVPPPGFTPLNPPPPGVDNVYVANSAAMPTVVISEGYNPEAPALSASAVMPQIQPAVPMASVDFSVPPPTIQYQNSSWVPPPVYPASSTAASVLVHPPPVTYDPIQPSTTTVPIASTPIVPVSLPPSAQVSRGGGPMRRGRGAGGFGPSASNTASTNNNRTLQVRKIPPEMNNITKLNEHFAQFGPIVNIQVGYDGDLEAALITYSTRLEAMAAYKSTMPILNNRFIKVFWHQPGGQTGQNTKNAQPATGSSVRFNAKGSLTKTITVGGQNSAVTANSVQVDGNEKPQGFPASRHRSTPSESEKYAEMQRKRKQAKEARMRLLDLHRRKTDLLSKQIEQQKLVFEKIQKTTNSDTKKELFKLFKTLDASVETLKKEIEDLASKLMKLAQESEEIKKTANGDSTVESNGVNSIAGVKRGMGDNHNSEANSPPKKPRHADSSQALDMRTRVVVIRAFPAEYENEVVTHMENFGDLEDVDIPDRSRGKLLTAYFTYKKRRDAEQAVELGSEFAFCQLAVEWGPKGGYEEDGVIPDEKRNPAERVTPAALLASCPLDESDEDGAED